MSLHLKTVYRNPFLIFTAIGITACAFQTNKTSPEGEEPLYRVVHNFTADAPADSENGLVAQGNRLAAVLSLYGGRPKIWTMQTDGTGEAMTDMHSPWTYKARDYYIQQGFVNAGSKIYGVTRNGGTHDMGTIYTIDPLTAKYTIEYSFTTGCGSPEFLPAYDGKSALYGKAKDVDENTVLYQYNTQLKKIVRIVPVVDEKIKYGSSSQKFHVAPDGKIYANDMSGDDGGWVFCLNSDLNAGKLVRAFKSATGAGPSGNLVFINNRIYGTASEGGTGDHGLVYSMKTDGSDYKILGKFNGANGHLPEGILLASDGMLYGTCFSGGKTDEGTLYRVKPDGTGFSIVWHFNEALSGGSPIGDMVEVDGKLYGLTRRGGTAKSGLLFCLDLKKIGAAK